MAKVGRPVGSSNKRCATAQLAITKLIDRHSAYLDEALLQIREQDPEKFLNYFWKLAEYGIPKLARTELASDADSPLQVVINYPNEN